MPVLAPVLVLAMLLGGQDALAQPEYELEPEGEPTKVSIHMQPMGGIIWLQDGLPLDNLDGASLLGVSVRTAYAFNQYLAFEAGVMGGSTGPARFKNVVWRDTLGEVRQYATLGRVHLGGLLHLGTGRAVPLVRLALGAQGTGYASRFLIESDRGSAVTPGPELPFEVSLLLIIGTGIDFRVTEQLRAGVDASFIEPRSGVGRSAEFGFYLGYAWNP